MLFPTEYIYVLNIVIVLILALFAYSGYRQGFLLKVLGCIGFIVVGFVAWFLSSPFGKLLHLFPKDMTPMKGTLIEPIFYESINRMVVFVILFVILGIFVVFLRSLLKVVGKLPVIAEVNKVLGILVGFVQGWIVLMILSFAFSTPLFANGTSVIERSFLKPVDGITEKALFFASDTVEELKSVQKIVTPSTALTDVDVEHIRQWLERYDLPQAQVNAFLQELLGD